MTCRLKLFPPTINKCTEYCINEFFESFSDISKKHLWISKSKIEGISSDKNNVIFFVYDNPSKYNGFLSFEVIWYVYYTSELNLNAINGFKMGGNEMNLFYPPEIALKTNILYNKENMIDKISVTSN